VCRGTGYLGRTGIFEVMEMTDRIREEVNQKASPLNIKKIAQGQGMNTLRENAIKKLLKGITTVDEVIRVTGQSQ
jgi:type II secretory ATPase GspE/PulE/Tfp pilus assembly ATPase PilB-like protein